MALGYVLRVVKDGVSKNRFEICIILMAASVVAFHIATHWPSKGSAPAAQTGKMFK